MYVEDCKLAVEVTVERKVDFTVLDKLKTSLGIKTGELIQFRPTNPQRRW